MGSKLKLLHIIYSGLGGHGNVTFSFIKADLNDHFTHGIVFYGIEKPKPEYIENCERLKLRYYYIDRKKNGFLQSIKLLNQSLKDYKPDFILTHTSSAVPAVIIYKLKHSVRSFLRETQANHLKTSKEWIFSLLAMLSFDKIILLSDQYRESLKKKLGLFYFRNKVAVIPNGLDLNKFKRSIHKGQRNILVLGMQSRINNFRDHETLLKAFQLLSGKKYVYKLKLEIAGDGENLSKLVKLAKSLKIADDVTFHGMLSETELIKFMDNLDIYIHCTFGETMSTSIMQALAMGLPVIASDVKGVNNLIVDGENGMLVPHSDSGELTKATDQMIVDSDLRIKIANNGRTFSKRHLSNSRMFNDYCELFNTFNGI